MKGVCCSNSTSVRLKVPNAVDPHILEARSTFYIYPIFRAKMYIYVTRSKDRGGYVWGYPSAFRY